jgi:hypothetical protein
MAKRRWRRTVWPTWGSSASRSWARTRAEPGGPRVSRRRLQRTVEKMERLLTEHPDTPGGSSAARRRRAARAPQDAAGDRGAGEAGPRSTRWSRSSRRGAPPDDLVVDAGNSLYTDTIRREREYAGRLKFFGSGVSGASSGALRPLADAGRRPGRVPAPAADLGGDRRQGGSGVRPRARRRGTGPPRTRRGALHGLHRPERRGPLRQVVTTGSSTPTCR